MLICSGRNRTSDIAVFVVIIYRLFRGDSFHASSSPEVNTKAVLDHN